MVTAAIRKGFLLIVFQREIHNFSTLVKNDQGIIGGLCSQEKLMATRPKLHQHTFDHLQHLIHKIKDRAATRHDVEISNDADLLGSILLLFVEEFILEGSITPGHVTPHA